MEEGSQQGKRKGGRLNCHTRIPDRGHRPNGNGGGEISPDQDIPPQGRDIHLLNKEAGKGTAIEGGRKSACQKSDKNGPNMFCGKKAKVMGRRVDRNLRV